VPEEGVVESTWYWEVPDRFGGSGRYDSSLAEHRPAHTEAITAEAELVLRQVALAARAENRACNGAPPTPPHPSQPRPAGGSLAAPRPAHPEAITAEAELVLRQVALAARAENRAYNGAPPTIPHPIDAREVDGCLACHGEGMVLADGLIATRMPHEHLPGCT